MKTITPALTLLALSGCGAAFGDLSMDALDTGMFAPQGEADHLADDTASGDQFDAFEDNPWVVVADQPVSTFSADVDSAAYAIGRRYLNDGALPPRDSVRIEEYLNFFDYEDALPEAEDPLAATLQVAPSPYAADQRLLRIGVKAMEVPVEEMAPVNLVFLIDVSGSMSAPNKLGLVKYSLSQLVERLRPTDTLSIVTYAGSERIVLQPTQLSDKADVLEAIEGLQSGGSTNGEAGIDAAYGLAQDHFDPQGVNRVVLCTDGDFNVGRTGDGLVRKVADMADEGVYLSVFGFGHGNLDDAFMEKLTGDANGTYGYIDSKNEALRALGEDLAGSLQVVAKDVKLQLQFDADVVHSYRLIGYVNRILREEDFSNDAVDAGDVGAGHSVVALYELKMNEQPSAEDDYAELRMRYKAPSGGDSVLMTEAIPQALFVPSMGDASEDMRMSAAVAGWARILRDGGEIRDFTLDDMRDLAVDAFDQEDGKEVELLELIDASEPLLGTRQD